SAFAYLLGRVATSSTSYYFDKTGNAYSPATGQRRTYAYNEYEAYAQDNWRIGRSLVLNLGVRYYLSPAPYEVNGFQADNSIDLDKLIATRVANAAAGIATPTSEPLLVYDLSGKANNGAVFYRTDKNNFAPRLGFNFHPSIKRGLGGILFGTRANLHGSFAVAYDRLAGIAADYQDDSDYLFSNSSSKAFGNLNPVVALSTDPRFIGLTSA